MISVYSNRRRVAAAMETFVPLPSDVIKHNGGQRCDMQVGPCACGAWHPPQPAAPLTEPKTR